MRGTQHALSPLPCASRPHHRGPLVLSPVHWRHSRRWHCLHRHCCCLTLSQVQELGRALHVHPRGRRDHLHYQRRDSMPHCRCPQSLKCCPGCGYGYRRHDAMPFDPPLRRTRRRGCWMTAESGPACVSYWSIIIDYSHGSYARLCVFA